MMYAHTGHTGLMPCYALCQRNGSANAIFIDVFCDAHATARTQSLR